MSVCDKKSVYVCVKESVCVCVLRKVCECVCLRAKERKKQTFVYKCVCTCTYALCVHE